MSEDIDIIDMSETGQPEPEPPAAAPPAPDTALAPADLPASIESLATMADTIDQVVERVHATQLVTSTVRGRRDECFAIALRGHELGIPIMQALGGDLFIVDGKVGMSAELMRALVARDGHRIDVTTSTSAEATLSGVRTDTKATAAVTWTIDDAKRAGLTGPTRNGKPSTWDKYPRAMLTARATSELCRLLFPDVLRGVSYTREELDSIAPRRNVVPATVVEHDWPAMGWADQAEHDAAMTTTRTALAEATDAIRAALLAEWNADGLSWPLTADQITAWHATCTAHGINLDVSEVVAGADSELDVEQPADALPTKAAGPTTAKRSTGGRTRVEATVLDEILTAGKTLDLTVDETRQLAETIIEQPIPELGVITRTNAERILVGLLAQLAEYTSQGEERSDQ